ncbi:FeoB-associated Cys-rich membrane protein [Pseudodesulfovibrio sp. JC047]|uniref:FeoB-associated Cys-rich membrane protein n=1 Tax=Pseudodesulfovibrio sp. JC047 TaxID=2683199 RepID=UPI0013D0807B|nr:FeoB-associated Cys-rich membrane protein [Pseudodesulfovibrio sp. JC047]NDV19024.1 FeoB-associated Cys-rich membrane protein [Pseudodesulfovibrio sp. JC047]
MIDTLLAIGIVIIAAFFVGRRLVRQFRTTGASCGCAGCGQAGSCSSIQNKPHSKGCPGSH